MNIETTLQHNEKITPEIPLLTAEQQAGLSKVDSKPATSARASAISEMVGVLVGLKPAALMRDDYIDLEDIEAVGLSYESMDDSGHYAVSKDEAISEDLRDVFQLSRDEDGQLTTNGHRQIGKLLGYPETATDYFLKRMDTYDTPEELPLVRSRSLQGTPGDFLHQFILSADNSQEEIQNYVMPLVAAVKELTPNTYHFIEEESDRDNETRRKQSMVHRKIGKFIRRLVNAESDPEYVEPKTIYVD